MRESHFLFLVTGNSKVKSWLVGCQSKDEYGKLMAVLKENIDQGTKLFFLFGPF